MKSYSLYRVLKNGLKSYDPEKGDAFSYFTRAVFQNYYNVALRYYRKLNAHENYVKDCLIRFQNLGMKNIQDVLQRFGLTEMKDEE